MGPVRTQRERTPDYKKNGEGPKGGREEEERRGVRDVSVCTVLPPIPGNYLVLSRAWIQ